MPELFDATKFSLMSRNRLRHPVAIGMDGNAITIPVEVLVGRSRVPRVTLVAGTHGNELEGILALQRLCRELEPEQLEGTITAILVANPLGLLAHQRQVPVDGVDLNRAFPGRDDGSFSERLASALFSLVQRSDFLYSLHSWGAQGIVTPYVEFPGDGGPVAQRSFEIARRLGFDLLRTSQWHPGLLVACAVKAGIPAVEAEIGGLGISTPEGRELYRTTLYNLLRALQVIDGEPSPGKSCHLVRSLDVRTRAGGLLVPAVMLRQEVREGDLLGTVVDLFGERTDTVVAPSAGIVAAYRAVSSVHAGEVSFTLFIPLQEE